MTDPYSVTQVISGNILMLQKKLYMNNPRIQIYIYSFDMDYQTQIEVVQLPPLEVPELPAPAVPAATANQVSTRNRTSNNRLFNDDYDSSS